MILIKILGLWGWLIMFGFTLAVAFFASGLIYLVAKQEKRRYEHEKHIGYMRQIRARLLKM